MRTILAVVAGLALTGCVTPYGRKGAMGGYTDFRVNERTFFVSVDGNGYTDRATLTSYFHRRAKEICGGPYEFKANTDTDSELATFGNSLGTINRHSVGGYIECANTPSKYVSSEDQPGPYDDYDEDDEDEDEDDEYTEDL